MLKMMCVAAFALSVFSACAGNANRESSGFAPDVASPYGITVVTPVYGLFGLY